MATKVLTQTNTPSTDPTQWHAGNLRMHSLMSIPPIHNPTHPYLTPPRAISMSQSPLFAIGTLDSEGRPWTSLWGGEKGFLSPINQNTLGISNIVDRANDPVLKAFEGDKEDSQVFGAGKPVSGLSIDLETRRRVKVSGVIKGWTLQGGQGEDVAMSQVVVDVDSSLGNCPKYLNIKHIRPHLPSPSFISHTFPLPAPAIHLLKKADLFFLTASSTPTPSAGFHLSTNHRGGSPGFLRILSNTPENVTLAYPEYSGNRYYQTLGNLQLNPRAGIVVPDFENGDVLYASCKADILTGKEAGREMPGAKLLVVLRVEEGVFVAGGLGFRGSLGEGKEGGRSPYNPRVRRARGEVDGEEGKKGDGGVEREREYEGGNGVGVRVSARLVEREVLSADVARLRFETDEAVKWAGGQYAILDFMEELGTGYAHMNDDDPGSLNDDLVRSFTVTSTAPRIRGEGEEGGKGVKGFEITVRDVGKVTKYLVKKGNLRAGVRAGVVGFEGSFRIEMRGLETVGFVAGGVGITPLLGQIQGLNVEGLRVMWAVGVKDLSVVAKIVKRWERQPRMTLYVSGSLSDEDKTLVEKIRELGVSVENRRMEENDFKSSEKIQRWYVCTGPQLKKRLDVWLQDREIISEEFNY